jgi:hypothetical protein
MQGKKRPLKPTSFQFVKCEQDPRSVLPEGMKDSSDLSKVLREFEQSEKPVRCVRPLTKLTCRYLGLESSILAFETWMCQTTKREWSFYSELLPCIVEWAVQFELARPVILLEQGYEASNEVTALEVRFILANAFFLNLHNLRMTLCAYSHILSDFQ